MVPRSRSTGAPRRAVILLVVVVLLVLFALVGLGFVFYAGAEATAARLFRAAQSPSRPDAEPGLLFSYFLGQLLYDVPDDETGVYSGLRGHSLSRNLFGLNYAFAPDGSVRLAANDVPFNGTGRLHYAGPLPGSDDYDLINYTYFPGDRFLRDPERYTARPGLRPAGAPDNRPPYVGGFNAPYTYPDLNHLFLAAVKAGATALPDGPRLPEGTVLMPSFHRPWLFGRLTDIPNVPPGNPGNRNWTNQEGKYLLLRPRPVDMGPGFPYPEDEGGDVKNLIGSPGTYDPVTRRVHNNDSIWLDLDFPVLRAADGRKFKPLFAPLIVDLDNRVNLNVHGNLRGTNRAAHASNQGWGAWEVSLAKVLDHNPLEWKNLLHDSRGPRGRYGPDPWPHSPRPGTLAGPGPPRFYAPVDWDGSNELANGAPSGRLQLPGTPPALPYQCFPTVPAGYGNRSAAERANHPGLYNPFRPAPPDRAFDLSNLEALLRHGDTGSPALAAELLGLCPQNFAGPADPAAAARRRHLVTLRSFDRDRPGVTPWFWPANPSAYSRLPALAPPAHPVGRAVGSPPLSGLLPLHPDSEFGPDWRAAPGLTALRRLDLNRYLPDYPSPDATGHLTNPLAFTVAQTARQHLAAEVFERLWRLSGAGNPSNPALLPPPGAANHDAERWNALRSLAQLAVNLVDFRDPDDYLTPFQWAPASPANPAGEWVFGTELPRLVLNEAYVQYDNDPADPGVVSRRGASHYAVHVWVELHNPLAADAALSHQGAAVLQVGSHAVYQVVLCRKEPGLRDPRNGRGNPAHVLRTVTAYGPDASKWRVLPSNRQYAGPAGGTQGFYVLGPQAAYLPGADPNLPATLLSPEMAFPVDAREPLQPTTILLRRLACPHLPPDPNPAAPGFNPYVTVDYLEDVPAADGRLFDEAGPRLPEALAARTSWGRNQPYAGALSQRAAQAPLPPAVNQPQHTFFRHNAREPVGPPSAATPGQTLAVPFDWLVHLDRRLISPMELVHVSAYKPHELTQQFVTGDAANQRFAHRAPWLDEDLAVSEMPQSHRLYRALEFFAAGRPIPGLPPAGTTSPQPLLQAGPNRPVRPRAMAGTTATGGDWRIEVGSSLVIDRGLPTEEVVRVRAVTPNRFRADFLKPHPAGFTITPTAVSERLPGKINLNTVWDEATFQALCDAQPGNGFNAAAVTAVFNQLKRARTVSGEIPGRDDRPFRSLATGFTPDDDGQFPGGGLADTLLRSVEGRPVLAVPGAAHPYQAYELLTKIFNHVTVRSNVFAVWVTVGFFEVTDDTTRPVKLGAEIGRAQNRHVRHRLFAVVDRSLLSANPGPQPAFDPRAGPSPGAAAGSVVPYFSIID